MEYLLGKRGGGVNACFSLLPLSTPPWDLPLPTVALIPYLHFSVAPSITSFFYFFFIFYPAEPARFTGLKWKSIHRTGTAGEMEMEREGGGTGLR